MKNVLLILAMIILSSCSTVGPIWERTNGRICDAADMAAGSGATALSNHWKCTDPTDTAKMRTIFLKPFDLTICRYQGVPANSSVIVTSKGLVSSATCTACIAALAPVLARGAKKQFPSCDESIMLKDALQLAAICPLLGLVPTP